MFVFLIVFQDRDEYLNISMFKLSCMQPTNLQAIAWNATDAMKVSRVPDILHAVSLFISFSYTKKGS